MTSARDFLKKEDPVDQGCNLEGQERKQRVSVPLNDMERPDCEGGALPTSVKNFLRNYQGACPEPKRSCVRSEEVLRERLEVPKEKGKGRIDEETLDELDRYTIEKVGMGAAKIQKLLEEIVQDIVQGIMQKIQAEKAKCEAKAAAEQEMLRGEVMKLSRRFGTIWAEKLCIQGEKYKLQKEIVDVVLKWDKDKQNDEAIVAALRSDLAKEQDKSCCQICFTAPRDALVLPCTHFQYCHDCLQKYQKRSKECPTCRGMINGVIQCNLSSS